MRRSSFLFFKGLGLLFAILCGIGTAVLGWFDGADWMNIAAYSIAVTGLILWGWYHFSVKWINEDLKQNIFTKFPKEENIKNKIFDINIAPNIPYKNSGCSLNKAGPGLTPWIIKPVKITAVVALPGIPKASVGTIAPPVAALFAASAPATPSIEPFPNSSGLLDHRFASEYPINEATVPPSAGRIPINEPIPDDLNIVFHVTL